MLIVRVQVYDYLTLMVPIPTEILFLGKNLTPSSDDVSPCVIHSSDTVYTSLPMFVFCKSFMKSLFTHRKR